MLTKNTFHMMVIPDKDLHDCTNPRELRFLAGVFHSHVVYLVNEVYCTSLLFFNLYKHIEDYTTVHI